MKKIIQFGISVTRLRLRTRIFLGFGMLIALLLGIAGYGCYGLSVVGEEIDKMDGIAGNTNRSQELALRMEQVRRGLADYQLDGDSAALQEVTTAATRAATLLKDAADSTLSDKRRTMFNGIIETLHGFTAKQEHFAAVRAARTAGRDKLLDVAKALAVARTQLADAAAASGNADDAAAVSAALLAELTAETSGSIFLGSLDPERMAVFKKDAAAAAQALGALGGSTSPTVKAALPPVVSGFDLYASTFSSASATMIEAEGLYTKDIRPVIREMQHATSDSLDKLTRAFSLTSEKAATISANTLTQQLMMSGGATLIGLVLAFLIARTIIRPINGMTAAMTKLATGDTESDVPGRDKTDEIGEMARAVEVFKTSMIEAGRLGAEQEATQAARARRQDAMDRHTETFGSSVGEVMSALGTAAQSMRRAADVMAESADAVRHQASETAQGAGKSSADLTSVAAAVEQFTASVGEISRQVAVAAEVAGQAVQRAEASQITIRGLADSTARIGDIVRLIDSIAGQTNLLALNATIEAARAGDAGKGFAVVAGEVKALAAQTAKATADISAQIETVRGATENTVTAMNEIGNIIGRMGEVSTAISAAVEEQRITTREIAVSIQGVAGSTAQAAQAMEDVVKGADRAGDASRYIQADATEVGSEADKLRQEVERFLQAVQADAGERRRSERLRGDGITATLRLAGATPVRVIILDISQSGIALRHGGAVAVGRDVEVDVPDAGGPITGRVVRVVDNVVAIAFGDEPTMIARITRALTSLSAIRKVA